LRGVTAKGVPAWDEQSGSQLADKIKIKTLVNVMKTSKETDTINFNNMFLTFRFVEKPPRLPLPRPVPSPKLINGKIASSVRY